MIRVQIVKDGEVTDQEEFDGLIGVGFNDGVDENNVVSRLLNSGTGASMVLGYLSVSDFISARAIVDDIARESLEEIGLDLDDVEAEIFEEE